MYNKKALTLLEIVISLSIIAIVFVGIATAFGVVMNGLKKSNLELIATNLARGLMAEIMAKRFDENFVQPWSTTLGPDGGEMRFGTPAYDDVDDYKALDPELPPRSPDMQIINLGITNVDIRRYVRCGYAYEASGEWDTQTDPSNYKLITVTVHITVGDPAVQIMPDLILEEIKAANAE